jgi:tetratricopeptide (TPR) repeat protein
MPADAAYDVFLSYARADNDPHYDDPTRSFVRRLYDALTAAGLRVWWDRKALPSRSTPFPTEIERAIHDCLRFLFVVAPGAIASEWVQAELRCALHLCKTITPILRAGDYDLLPPSLSDINMIDCRPTRDFDTAMSDVIDRLKHAAPIAQPYGLKRPLPDHYIVREKPLNDARAAICADAVRPTVFSAPPNATAVYGMGGVGKSTLATALVQDCQVRRHFKDGILWIEVGQTPSVTALQATVGVHYGDDRERYKTPTEAQIALSQKLHEIQALLVLDDVWDHEVIQAFPVSGTQCRLLITTRSRVLADKIGGKDIPVDLLTPHEGAQLLAAAVDGSADDPLYAQISTAFEGHTLSIELAAARLRKRGASFAQRLLDGLEDMANPFADLNVDADDKNLNLEKSLAQSYFMLDNDDLRRFRLLGIFAREGTVNLAALAAVWGDADEKVADRALEVLLDADLIQPASDGRYRQHRLLHAYARALLVREGEYEEAFARYADYVITIAMQSHELPSKQFAMLDLEQSHLFAVGDGLVARTAKGTKGDLLRARDFAYYVKDYLYHRRNIHRINWLEMGLNATRSSAETFSDPRVFQECKALFLNELAVTYSSMGDEQKALYCHQEALDVRFKLGDRLGEATTLNNIADIYRKLGQPSQALLLYERSLMLDRISANPSSEATTLHNIGFIWEELGNLEKADEYYIAAAKIMEFHGTSDEKTALYNNRAGVLLKQGKFFESLSLLDQSISYIYEFNKIDDIALYRTNRSRVLYRLNRLDEAIQELEVAINLLISHRFERNSGGGHIEQLTKELLTLKALRTSNST